MYVLVRFSVHLAGFLTQRNHPVGLAVQSNDGGLVQQNFPGVVYNNGIGRSQVHCQLLCE